MEGYPIIGSMYILRHPDTNKRLVWGVIANDSNFGNTILEVLSESEEKGDRRRISSSWLMGIETLGPILEPNGEIVIEGGIEFVRPTGDSEIKRPGGMRR